MKYKISSNQTLLDALIFFFPKSSKTTLRSWIKERRVWIDEVCAKTANEMLKEGQELSIGQKKKFASETIPILYEDKDFVVIDKPSGLLSVSTAFEKSETAHSFLKAYYRPRRVHVVHRLDQDTSGVMLFALTEKSCENLKKIFEAHEIERHYLAIVEGKMDDEGTWESYLFEDEDYFVHSTSDSNKGELAITHYRTLKASKSYSLLDIKLETGKKNQIRVHCQEAGHPVIGDKKYGAKSNPIKRLGLHAYSLAFLHPTLKKKMVFKSPIPKSFSNIFPNNV